MTRKPIPWMYLRLSASRAISVPTARNAAIQAELFRLFTNNAGPVWHRQASAWWAVDVAGPRISPGHWSEEERR